MTWACTQRKDWLRVGWHGVLLCHGVTSHSVHAGGIAAGPGFLSNTSRWAQTCHAALQPLPSPLHTQLVSSPYSLPHVESQTKRNALFIFWWDDVGVVITSFFRETHRCGKLKSLGVSRDFASRLSISPHSLWSAEETSWCGTVTCFFSLWEIMIQ